MRNFTWLGLALAIAGALAGCSEETFVVEGTTSDLTLAGQVRVLWAVDDAHEDEESRYVIDGDGSAAEGRFTLVLDEDPPGDARVGGGVGWGRLFLFPEDFDLPKRGTIVTDDLREGAIASADPDLLMWLVDGDPEPGSEWNEGYNCVDGEDPETEREAECRDLVIAPIAR